MPSLLTADKDKNIKRSCTELGVLIPTISDSDLGRDLGRAYRPGEDIEESLLKEAMEVLGPIGADSVLPGVKPLLDTTNESVSNPCSGGNSPPKHNYAIPS